MNYSYSAISSFKSCPKSFEYKYIRKAREAFISVERHMGSCVHEILHWLYDKRLNREEPKIQPMKKEYERVWNGSELDRVRVIKKENTFEYYFDRGAEFLSTFFQKIFPEDDSVTLQLEYHFEIELDNQFKYRGIIDRIARQPNGLIRVTDFKTGKVSHPLDNFQLPSYALYIFEQYPEESIELCLEDLSTPQTVVARFERQGLEKVKSELGEEIGLISNTSLFLANSSVLCQWCGYNGMCEDAHESVKSMARVGDLSGDQRDPDVYKEGEKYCPECGGLLKRRKGKFGAFWGCSNFPECRYTLDIKESGGPVKSVKVAGEICPECGGVLRKRKGKFGSFLGCNNYPECQFTRKIKDK